MLLHSAVLNPHGKHYDRLLGKTRSTFEDNYYLPDAIVMEHNSRDFRERVRMIDANAMAAVELLCGAYPVIAEVYHPSMPRSKSLYDVYRVREGGYGGLLSLRFVSPEAAHAFYDNLPCAKGPSLGTNFTLACCYTVLAHFHELEWAQSQGLDPDLVRISVGMEDRDTLLKALNVAISAAKLAAGRELGAGEAKL
jgi:cystathionine gamma-synthase